MKIFSILIAGITVISATALTSCNNDLPDDGPKADGTNWKGRTSGKLESTLDKENFLITYTKNVLYTAKDLVIPGQITIEGHDYNVVLGDNLFNGNKTISGTLTLQEGIQEIKSNVFIDNTNLRFTHLKIPSTVSSIGGSAFVFPNNVNELTVYITTNKAAALSISIRQLTRINLIDFYSSPSFWTSSTLSGIENNGKVYVEGDSMTSAKALMFLRGRGLEDAGATCQPPSFFKQCAIYNLTDFILKFKN